MRTACSLFLHCRKWMSTPSCLLSLTSCANLTPCTLVEVLASGHDNIRSETRQWAMSNLWCTRREAQVTIFRDSGTNVLQCDASHSHSTCITTSQSSESSHGWLHLRRSVHWVCSSKDSWRGFRLFFYFNKIFMWHRKSLHKSEPHFLSLCLCFSTRKILAEIRWEMWLM